MSRAFTPPSTLSEDDIRTMANVRRDIWTSAFKGMGIGACSGLVAHMVLSFGTRRGIWRLPAGRNTAVFAVLFGGSFGSFLMATTTGKNEVHYLHPIFEVGAVKPSTSSYQETLQRAKERETELRTLERLRKQRTADGIVEDVIDYHDLERIEREKNRLYRRATLSRAIEEGHGGLSDAHGGHWVADEDTLTKE